MSSVVLTIIIFLLVLVLFMALGFAIKVKDTDNILVRIIKIFFKILFIGIPLFFILAAIL